MTIGGQTSFRRGEAWAKYVSISGANSGRAWASASSSTTSTRWLLRAVTITRQEHVAQQRIRGREHIAGKEYPEFKADLDGALDDGHLINVKGWTLQFEIYLNAFANYRLNLTGRS